LERGFGFPGYFGRLKESDGDDSDAGIDFKLLYGSTSDLEEDVVERGIFDGEVG
jgi:hypothetical protein